MRHTELRLVSENEIRITLSREEMAKLDIDADSFSDARTAKSLVSEIFERAGEHSGFVDGDAVSVRIYPRRSGGCELYVRRTPDAAGKKRRERIYRFGCADDFLEFFSFLGSDESSLLDTLYIDGEVYVRFPGLLSLRSERILEEFAVRLRGGYLWEYLSQKRSSAGS